MSAGAVSLIASLWNVADSTTASLMLEFYDRWHGASHTKAQALRQAMLSVKQTHPHPYYWAPFTLMGEAD
jgi:CHAT domain-containing protein